jgi:3-methyladenine DNA glycosylase AlkD
VSSSSAGLTANRFVARLRAVQSDAELAKIQRYFKSGAGEYGEGDTFLGVRMGDVFSLAKEFIDLPPAEIERLLESDLHEVRAGGLSVMDKQARRTKTPEYRRKELYDLYLGRMDRINNWDLVDLAAPFVVGGYLFEYGKPRDVLFELARSANVWERRTAIASTASFLRQGEADDTFRIAEILLDDPEEIINKAVGGWLRVAGDIDRPRLLALLDGRAATMPRVTLRFALEHVEPEVRAHYMGLKTAAS